MSANLEVKQIVGILKGSAQDSLYNLVAAHIKDCGFEVKFISPPANDRIIFWLYKYLRNRFDILYVLGSQEWSNRFHAAKLLNKPTILHWIGTDVYNILTYPERRKRVKNKVLPLVDINLAVAEKNASDLNGCLGIKSEIVPIVDFNITTVSRIPLPEKPGIFTYICGNSGEKVENRYGLQKVIALAKNFLEIPFEIIGYEDESNNTFYPKNIKFLGWVKNMEEVYRRNSMYLRLTTYDGLPKMVLESLAWGRQVIFSHPFPHCYHTANNDDATNILKSLLTGKLCFNEAGRNFVLNEYSHNTVTAKWYKNLSKL